MSEVALLIFGLVLAIGAIGEAAKSEKWKQWKRTFEMVVILGIAGEFFADAGIFVFSRHLQTISDAELQSVTKDVGDTHLAAEKSALAASHAEDSAKQTNAEAKNSERAAQNAKVVADNAESLAHGARHDVEVVGKDLDSAKKQVSTLSAKLTEANRKADEELQARLKIEAQLINVEVCGLVPIFETNG